jgi:ornithine cyclodeaminase
MFQPNVQQLVVFGAGTQAECHIRLIEIAVQRKIPKITIINRSIDRAKDLKVKIEEERNKERKSNYKSGTDDPASFTVNTIALNDIDEVSSALATADVVAATTNTATPLWNDAGADDGNGKIRLKKGCLVTGIGSYTPEMQEIPTSIVNNSAVVIDTPEAIAVGDLKHLGTTFEIAAWNHPIYLAGHAFTDPTIVRTGQSTAQKDYIFYKAVGTAIQDVLTAHAVIQKAKELGIGQVVDMS